jgi:hypothetical protein
VGLDNDGFGDWLDEIYSGLKDIMKRFFWRRKLEYLDMRNTFSGCFHHMDANKIRELMESHWR